MNLMTSVKGFFAVVVLAVAIAVAYNVYDPGRLRTDTDDDRQRVTLIVTFNRETSRPVITYQVGAQIPQGATPTTGKWSEDVFPSKGDLVILAVNQRTTGHTQCYIIHRDVVEETQQMMGPGAISCQYKVA